MWPSYRRGEMQWAKVLAASVVLLSAVSCLPTTSLDVSQLRDAQQVKSTQARIRRDDVGITNKNIPKPVETPPSIGSESIAKRLSGGKPSINQTPLRRTAVGNQRKSPINSQIRSGKHPGAQRKNVHLNSENQRMPNLARNPPPSVNIQNQKSNPARSSQQNTRSVEAQPLQTYAQNHRKPNNQAAPRLQVSRMNVTNDRHSPQTKPKLLNRPRNPPRPVSQNRNRTESRSPSRPANQNIKRRPNQAYQRKVNPATSLDHRENRQIAHSSDSQNGPRQNSQTSVQNRTRNYHSTASSISPRMNSAGQTEQTNNKNTHMNSEPVNHHIPPSPIRPRNNGQQSKSISTSNINGSKGMIHNYFLMHPNVEPKVSKPNVEGDIEHTTEDPSISLRDRHTQWRDQIFQTYYSAIKSKPYTSKQPTVDASTQRNNNTASGNYSHLHQMSNEASNLHDYNRNGTESGIQQSIMAINEDARHKIIPSSTPSDTSFSEPTTYRITTEITSVQPDAAPVLHVADTTTVASKVVTSMLKTTITDNPTENILNAFSATTSRPAEVTDSSQDLIVSNVGKENSPSHTNDSSDFIRHTRGYTTSDNAAKFNDIADPEKTVDWGSSKIPSERKSDWSNKWLGRGVIPSAQRTNTNYDINMQTMSDLGKPTIKSVVVSTLVAGTADWDKNPRLNDTEIYYPPLNNNSIHNHLDHFLEYQNETISEKDKNIPSEQGTSKAIATNYDRNTFGATTAKPKSNFLLVNNTGISPKKIKLKPNERPVAVTLVDKHGKKYVVPAVFTPIENDDRPVMEEGLTAMKINKNASIYLPTTPKPSILNVAEENKIRPPVTKFAATTLPTTTTTRRRRLLDIFLGVFRTTTPVPPTTKQRTTTLPPETGSTNLIDLIWRGATEEPQATTNRKPVTLLTTTASPIAHTTNLIDLIWQNAMDEPTTTTKEPDIIDIIWQKLLEEEASTTTARPSPPTTSMPVVQSTNLIDLIWQNAMSDSTTPAGRPLLTAQTSTSAPVSETTDLIDLIWKNLEEPITTTKEPDIIDIIWQKLLEEENSTTTSSPLAVAAPNTTDSLIPVLKDIVNRINLRLDELEREITTGNTSLVEEINLLAATMNGNPEIILQKPNRNDPGPRSYLNKNRDRTDNKENRERNSILVGDLFQDTAISPVLSRLRKEMESGAERVRKEINYLAEDTADQLLEGVDEASDRLAIISGTSYRGALQTRDAMANLLSNSLENMSKYVTNALQDSIQTAFGTARSVGDFIRGLNENLVGGILRQGRAVRKLFTETIDDMGRASDRTSEVVNRVMESNMETLLRERRPSF